MLGKQLYIMCDMEGASQISPENRAAMRHGSEEWRKNGRHYITLDVKAVCEAANEFGIEDILINDAHDLGKQESNLLVDELPANARVIRRPHLPDTPRKMAQKDLFGAILVGQHAMYGGGGFAPHTIQSPPIAEVSINGVRLGETGLELACFMDVKFLEIVGEEAAVKEAQALCPNVVGVSVKSLEKNWFPTAEENYARIKEASLQALRRRESADSFHLEPPYRFSVKVTDNYLFNLRKKGMLSWLAAWFFPRKFKGRMNEREAFWEDRTISGGISCLHMIRNLMEKRPQTG